MRKFLIVLTVASVLAGCGGRQPLVSTPRLTVVQDNTTLPAPERGDLIAGDRPALIGPLDTIQIDVFNVPDLSREVQIDASGRISMPWSARSMHAAKPAGNWRRPLREH